MDQATKVFPSGQPIRNDGPDTISQERNSNIGRSTHTLFNYLEFNFMDL